MRTAFDIADELVDEMCQLDPVLATNLGIGGADDEWGDTFGLSGVEQVNDLRERYRPQMQPFISSESPTDKLAARVVVGELEQARSRHEAGDHFRDLRHLGSTFHRIRQTFDVMSVDTPAARKAIVQRLATVGKPLGDYRDLLEEGLSRDIVVSRRQVASIVDQARGLSSDPASIDQIVHKVEAAGGASAACKDAADVARAAYGEFADWLESGYLDRATADDGVGAEEYIRSADRLVGMHVDPDEAYAWGWEELNRLLSEQERVADLIRPGEGAEAVKEFLESDPSVIASGTGELISFVESTLEMALDDLAGIHFDVPEEIRPLTVRLAPIGSPLGVYYRPPSEDFPGRVESGTPSAIRTCSLSISTSRRPITKDSRVITSS